MDLEEIESNNEVTEGQAEPEVPVLAQKKPKNLKYKNNFQNRDKNSSDLKKLFRAIKNARKSDLSVFHSDDEDNEKKIQDLATDDSNHKVFITFDNPNPQMRVRKLAKMLTILVPNSDRIFHSYFSIKQIIQAATIKGYAYLIILKEDKGFISEPNGLTLIDLADKTEANFILSDFEFPNKMHHKEFTKLRRGLTIINFTTRSDKVLARMLRAVFHQDLKFKGKHVVAVFKKRNKIIFRHYKYRILNNKSYFRELGPRFTLKLLGKMG
ncbi:PREDICTED: probable ribosome production factor 1 [Diuraphis noxia]|uniref:probable ribosome production factor 1 n=1 Tax=Diuraphis noxia TaxID=143948 RepID=UPI000763684B|nr:PREDICTED: probable ribosome production factor 1 [Diuraphis noxia]